MNFTLRRVEIFPEGTVVEVYLAQGQPADVEPPRGAPVDTQTIVGGEATFTGLSEHTDYLAAAIVEDAWRYVRFSIPPLPTDVSVHALETTDVHGIENTANLIVEGDPRLTDDRDPTAHDHDGRYYTEAEIDAALAAGLALKAALNSPAFTGDPTVPTAAPGDNDTSAASTAFVAAALAAGAQPLDADLTALAALTTTVFGRDFAALADAAAARTKIGSPSVAEAILDALIDAKGDLIVGTAPDTPGVVGVGADDEVLTADAAEPGGVKWAVAPGAGGGMTPGGPAGGQLDGAYPDPDLDGAVAGAGLTGAGGAPLAVGAGTGITVNADDVAVNTGTIATLAAVAAGYQPLDGDLTAIAALSTTAVGRSLLAAADAAALRVITDAQQLDADLTAIAALATTAFGRSVLTQADAAAVRSLISAQQSDTELSAIAGLTSAVDKGIMFSGAGTAAVFDLSAAARTVLDDANVAAMLATLGGQPLDADLTAIAALTTTAFGRGLLALADAAAARSTLGLSSFGTRFGPTIIATANAAKNLGATNQMSVVGVNVLNSCTITGIEYVVGSTSNGSVRSALYDSAGNRLRVRTANLAQGVALTPQQVAFDSTYAAAPGLYFLGLWLTSATGTFHAGYCAEPAGAIAAGAGGPSDPIAVPAGPANHLLATTY